MPEKTMRHKYHTPLMTRCLRHLEDQKASPQKAHAVCYSSILGAGHKANKSLREVVEEAVKGITPEKASERAKAGWRTRNQGRSKQEEKMKSEELQFSDPPVDWDRKRKPGEGDGITHDRYSGEPITRLISGPKNYGFGGHYAHHKVVHGGKILEGGIQTKRSGGRNSSSTHFRDMAVLGHDTKWLIRMNQDAEAAYHENGEGRQDIR